MALVVEDGTGLSTAESYQAVAAISTFLDLHHPPADKTAWDLLTTAQMEQMCREGTQYLDLTFGQRWKSVRTNEVQALDWPRTGVEDRDGYVIDEDVLPADLLKAHSEATWRASTATMIPDIAAPVGDIQAEEVKIGQLKVKTEYTGGGSASPSYAIIKRYVQDLIWSGMGVRG